MNLDINIGDVLLAGRFKNKHIKVKSLGTDELGQPTFNKDRKLLSVRIEKKLPEKMWSTKSLAKKYKDDDMDKKAYLGKAYDSAFNIELAKLAQPSEAQAEAGNYKKKHIRYDGMDISIENPANSVRSGTSGDGKKWSNKLNHHYGYIRRTLGNDGDHIDVFINPGSKETKSVYIVNQVNPKNRKFDEHKCMLGFDTEAKAKAAYLSNYDKGWKGVGSITVMTIDEFKKWVYKKNKSAPVKEMAKKAFLEDVSSTAFIDELEKLGATSLQDSIKYKEGIKADRLRPGKSILRPGSPSKKKTSIKTPNVGKLSKRRGELTRLLKVYGKAFSKIR